MRRITRSRAARSPSPYDRGPSGRQSSLRSNREGSRSEQDGRSEASSRSSISTASSSNVGGRPRLYPKYELAVSVWVIFVYSKF